MRWRKPVRPELGAFAVASFTATIVNVPFWRQLHAAVAPRDAYEVLFIGAVLVVALSLLTLFFQLLMGRRTFKPLATALLLVSSAAAYFISEYGIVIDAGMLTNVLESDPAEMADLLTPKLLAYVVGLGVLPSLLLWTLTIAYRPFWQELRVKGLALVMAVVLVSLAALPFVQMTSVFRQHRMLLDAFMPLNYLSAVGEYGRKRLRRAPSAPTEVAGDAHKTAAWGARHRKSVTVIVLGETARAKSFSLNGYERTTNPLLATVPGLINFPRAYSCGTDTAQSLPCMFSGMGHAEFSIERAGRQEGLLDVLQRVGFDVLWRENQGGCKGVCNGVRTELMEGAGTRTLFELGGARDEKLLEGLPEKIAALKGHGVIVLHMMGSHGPAYYKRYPAAFERFKPACKESQFSRCTTSQIVNSYDNTIVYTDYVLFRLIELLRARDVEDVPTAMVYLSDHGESLGEDNIYLHGLPYAFAPDVQKHIPMVMWLSPKFQADFGVDTACVRRHSRETVSHDNLFHSVLGLLDVATRLYDAKLDVFAGCRSPRAEGAD